MSYRIEIAKPAAKFIHKLPVPDKERVLRAISKLPDEGDIKQMQGQKNNGCFRLRVGDYRVIYSVDHGKLIVCVIDAGHRGQRYKRY